MKNLILQIIAGILSLFLSCKFIPGIQFQGQVKIFLLAGLVLGILNYALKPILHFFFFPLKLITFGLFGLVINMGLVFVLTKYIFPNNFIVSGWLPLLFTTIVVSFFSAMLYSATKSFKKE
jgi:putative membrane protein